MKRNISLVVLFCINYILFSQIHFNSSEEAVIYGLQKSQQYSLNLQAANLSLKAAAYAINDFLPSFDFTISEDDSVSLNSTDSRNKSISANMNYTLFDGGKRIITYKMNKAEQFFQVKSAEQSIDSFRSTIINQYLNCLLQETLVDIKTKLEENAKIQLDILEKEYELGLALENSYLEYLISYKKILDEKRQAERELRSQYRTLKVLLGIKPESELILGKDEYRDFNAEKYLEPFSEKLWNIVKTKNPSVLKNDIIMSYQREQYKYNSRFYVPDLTFQGGVSFSGTNYPLRNPQYTVKFLLSFNNIPFVPSTISNSYGFDKNRLKNVSNSASSSVKLTPDEFYKRKLSQVQLRQSLQNYDNEINEMYENFFSQISTYDDLLDRIYRLNETLELENKRIEISKKQMETGELKRIDFLEELIELSQQQIELEEAKINFAATVRNLEIMLCIPFGGLEKCISE